jgi:hypothetical protein
LPPSEFFSGHSPRQAPGNSSVIRPMLGTATQTISEATVTTRKQAPTISASVDQR